jgi:hypothetical protein
VAERCGRGSILLELILSIFNALQWFLNRLRLALLLQAAEQEQANMLPGGIVTTAETRPNAYIPTEEHELPIPRPYGAHAPFRPSEPGSTMRHIRKPVPKPIEI